MNDNAEMKKQEREQVIELGSDLTKSGKGNIYTLTIIGQVEGHQVAPETVKTTKSIFWSNVCIMSMSKPAGIW